MEKFNGLGLHLGNLSRLSDAKTRSISPENFTGEKGKGAMSADGPAAKAAADLGPGWKVSPYFYLAAGQTFTLADIQGPGRHPTHVDHLRGQHLAIRHPPHLLG